MILTILHIAIVGALAIAGIRWAASPGYILHPVYRWFERTGNWFAKPVIGCAYCMASVWGTVVLVAFVAIGAVPFSASLLVLVPLNIAVTSPLAGSAYNLVRILASAAKAGEEQALIRSKQYQNILLPNPTRTN